MLDGCLDEIVKERKGRGPMGSSIGLTLSTTTLTPTYSLLRGILVSAAYGVIRLLVDYRNETDTDLDGFRPHIRRCSILVVTVY